MIRLQFVLASLITISWLPSSICAQQLTNDSVFNMQRTVRTSRLNDFDSNAYWRSTNSGKTNQYLPNMKAASKRGLNSRTYDFQQETDPGEVTEAESAGSNENVVRRKSNLAQWPESTLTEIQLDIREFSPQIPEDQSARLLNQYSRDWSTFASQPKTLMWDAPNLKYKPLLFEDVAIERYGQVVRGDYFQTVVSAAHFFSSAALLPLHAIHDPVYSCDTPLGYCRPGNCTQRIYQKQFWGLIR